MVSVSNKVALGGDRSRVKILLSAYACEPNKGSEPGVGWNWASHLASIYEVYVITRKNNQDIIEDYLNEHPIDHFHFYYHDCSIMMKKLKKLPNGIFLYYKKWQKEILPIAKRIVDEQNIDIVHHITFNEFRTPGKLYKLGKPFVWGPIGGGQFYNPVFREAYFQKGDLLKEKIRDFINRFYLNFMPDIRNVVNEASSIIIADQSTEKVMPQSRSYVRLLETAYNLERNGIKKYDEIHNGDMVRPIRLLWVGGIWPRKGLKVLLDALGESDFRGFELSIIGNGQDRQLCEQLAANYGIRNKVFFEGTLSYEQVNHKYDQADLFVFTSLRDTSGNVVLEAMSHGLPVITLNHHGAGEIVTKETGTKIDISSYKQIKKDIVDAMIKYDKNRDEMIKHGKNARKRIEEYYSWEHSVDAMSQIYDAIFAKSTK